MHLFIWFNKFFILSQDADDDLKTATRVFGDTIKNQDTAWVFNKHINYSDNDLYTQNSQGDSTH